MQTLVFEAYGLCGMLVQTVVLRYLLQAVGEVHVLKIGLAASSVQMVAMAFVNTKWQVGPTCRLTQVPKRFSFHAVTPYVLICRLDRCLGPLQFTH